MKYKGIVMLKCGLLKKISEKINSAFTLAEVLITLGILGVVAAMTIPTLMTKVQQFEFKTAAKKQYSILSQAYASILYDNSGSLAGVCSSAADPKNCFTDLFKDKMKYSKVCYDSDANSLAGACFAKTVYNYDGTVQSNSAGVDGGIVLNDGTAVWFVLWYPDCKQSQTFNGVTRDNYCGMIVFDVNGLKKPNTWGKDMYITGVFSNKLLPDNSWGQSYLYDVMNNIDY